MFERHRSFFTSMYAGRLAGLAVASLILAAAPGRMPAQAAATPATQATPASQMGAPTTSDPAPATSNAAQVGAATSPEAQPATAEATLSNEKKSKKPKVAKEDRVQHTKDTKVELRKQNKYNPLVGKDAQLPDKQLYDKAMAQTKSGHFDVARLDLQTLLNTYPDSQYQMRAKLAVADSWYREGGSASLAQAAQEYQDFITFFPNTPESAEAQMRLGDIYFKQMDVPDRDYSKATHAEEEYRTMLKQYPDAPKVILDQAKQKLREVQEVMATREADLGVFYATHENWPASIARYQTVIDTYPQYSHMDDTLIGMGDDYAAEARMVRAQPTCAPALAVPCMPEGAKARLEQEYDGKAAAAYKKVVMDHAAAPHVEDAKERLAGMSMPIPTPSAEQVAASEALEGSRAQYNLRKRLELLFLRRPDVVTAAGSGEPPLEDPAPTTAPTIVNSLVASFSSAINPGAPTTAPAPAAATSESEAAPATAPGGTPVAVPGASSAPAAPPMLSDVPAAGTSTPDSSTGTVTEAAPVAPAGARVGNAGASLGVEVLTPGVATPTDRDPSAPGRVSAPNTPPITSPASSGKQDPNYGLRGVAPANTAALPEVEKAGAAPDQVNELAGKTQPAAELKDPNKKKNPKPAFDKDDESSSKHKKKKGLNKVNPF